MTVLAFIFALFIVIIALFAQEVAVFAINLMLILLVITTSSTSIIRLYGVVFLHFVKLIVIEYKYYVIFYLT
jgi:hypothetical protein